VLKLPGSECKNLHESTPFDVVVVLKLDVAVDLRQKFLHKRRRFRDLLESTSAEDLS
jgi:hypothetical protein